MILKHTFPDEFLWGVATSSYQIEGAWNVDGKGHSIWDTFSHQSGNIKNDDNGDIACDHYNRWQEDIHLIKKLSVKAYRFSISWPRILPTGVGEAVNEKGLDFYDLLVDGLLAEGITPFVTLYHWDLPQYLQDQGGWPNRSILNAFEEYTNIVSHRLGDRVKHWITHNEPQVVSSLGYMTGTHAPSCSSWKQALETTHHILLSHGQAVQVIRSNVLDAQVGIAFDLCPAVPASNSVEDHKATHQYDGEQNRWFLDPVYRGKYPEDVLQRYLSKKRISEKDLSFIQDGDLNTISVPTDFLGVNYYSRAVIRSDEIPEKENAPREIFQGDCTDFGWEIHAPGLHQLLIRINNDYDVNSIYLTENGASYSTGPDKSGRILDQKRIHYIHDHLVACHNALSDGVPLKGYFAWTLIDNFEWAEGFDQKFGLVWMEPSSLKRIPKASYWWYQQVTSSNSIIPI